MKKIVILLFVIGFLNSCSNSEDNMLVDEIVIDEVGEMGMDEANYSMGDFVSGAHTTSGSVTINTAKTILTFKNFKTDDGPKLLVYLSTNSTASEYVDLGDLKGVEGDFTYNIPENTDLEKFKTVNIWCVDFLVSFGHAELK